MTGWEKRKQFGYLHVDHRFSPGLPEDVAVFCGYDPALCREGKVFEADTLGCFHCGAHVVVNPLRTRERCWCRICDRYVCDACGAAMKSPGYEHHHINEVWEKINTGKWALSGRSNAFVLTPFTLKTGGTDG